MAKELPQDLDKMLAHECGALGERLSAAGRWKEAKWCFFTQLEKGGLSGTSWIE